MDEWMDVRPIRSLESKRSIYISLKDKKVNTVLVRFSVFSQPQASAVWRTGSGHLH